MELKLVKNKLTLSEMSSFVQSVVVECFNQDEAGNDIDYTPIFKDVAIKLNLAKYYYGFESTGDVDADYEVYSEIELDKLGDVLNEINGKFFDKDQFDSIISAIESQIKFRKSKLLSASIESVNQYIIELLQKQIEVQDLQKVVLEQQKAINDAIPVEKQKEFMEKLSASNLTPDSLVDAYMKSGLHKKEVAKAKSKPQDRKPKQKKVSEKVSDKTSDKVVTIDSVKGE